MNAQFKHRLIGGLVLIAILAICLPLLLYHPNPELQTRVSSKIPEPPRMQSVQFQLPASMPQKSISTSVSVATKPIQPNFSKIPQAWAIQVATFEDAENALALIKRLRQDGFSVYFRKESENQRTLTKVYVGPQINEDKLKDLRDKLKKQYRLNGLITKYSA